MLFEDQNLKRCIINGPEQNKLAWKKAAQTIKVGVMLNLLSKTWNPLKTGTWTDIKRHQLHLGTDPRFITNSLHSIWQLLLEPKVVHNSSEYGLLFLCYVCICLLQSLRVCDVTLSHQFTTILIHNLISSCCSAVRPIFCIYGTDLVKSVWVKLLYMYG